MTLATAGHEVARVNVTIEGYLYVPHCRRIMNG